MTPFNISDEAVEQLRILKQRSNESRADYGIRIFISGLINGGPEWGLTLDRFDPVFDECCEFGDLRIMVERETLEAVGGLDVQYEGMEDGGGFLIVPLDPEVQALYNGGGCGGCGGGCGGCHGGCGSCHSCGGCGGCHSGEPEYEYDEGIGYDDED